MPTCRLAGGSICAAGAPPATFTASTFEMGWRLPPFKMHPNESKLLGTRPV